MRAVVHFVQDNAMFYKDITQWLRNRTFASLFFGLLLVAEALSLFIIAGSEDIGNPGTSMFYTLYMVLIIYAMLIAYLGNSLTAREFVNRTFELYELSGMSLERMVAGKVLSMVYQFMFGFFCLVPFMFFAYFLGGLDFIEMIVGVVMVCLAAVPLYLISLLAALTARYKQVNLLTRLASVFVLGWFVMIAFASFFTDQPLMREMVRETTNSIKQLFDGASGVWIGFIMFWLVYFQVCLLLFYLCCDSISRETDSREIPIKVLVITLIITWMTIFAARFSYVGYSEGSVYMMTVPVFVTLLMLGVRTFYNRPNVQPIVARKYANRRGVGRMLYSVLKPGVKGAVRTLFLAIVVATLAGTVAITFSNSRIGVFGASGDALAEWWSGLGLLTQVPWFLAIPHIFFARRGDMRYNFPAQRTLAITTWVVVGALVLIYLAWTQSPIFRGGYGGRFMSNAFEVVLVTLLSPLPSMTVIGTDDNVVQEAGGFLRIASGMLGLVLVYAHMRNVVAEENRINSEAEGYTGEETNDLQEPAPTNTADIVSGSGEDAKS